MRLNASLIRGDGRRAPIRRTTHIARRSEPKMGETVFSLMIERARRSEFCCLGA
jgi:hypothetical protein